MKALLIKTQRGIYLLSSRKMGTYNVQTHPELVFNGQSVYKLPGLFDSSNNRSDVGLIEVGIEGTKKKKNSFNQHGN